MSSVFRVESTDDGVFSVKTVRDEVEVCSVVFDDELGGALATHAQRAAMLSFVKILQKTCVDFWRRENGEE